MSGDPVALDTNVLVRFFMADDVAQARRARKLVESRAVLVAPTVLLETEWVLRSGYRCAAADIAAYLQAFLGLPQGQLEDAEAVSEALRGYVAGMDFAAALHLALSGPARPGPAQEFATFDRRRVKKASGLQRRKVRQP